MLLNKPKKKKKKTNFKKQADTLFSLRIRAVGKCFRCGATEKLQCAHIISRSYLATRWDLKNAVCLCSSCHVYFTYRPLEWEEYIGTRLGKTYYDTLKYIALTHQKPDYDAIIENLKNEDRGTL